VSEGLAERLTEDCERRAREDDEEEDERERDDEPDEAWRQMPLRRSDRAPRPVRTIVARFARRP